MDSKIQFEQSHQQLIQIIRARSYREGDFTLASGRKSKFYVDIKTTALHPEGAALIGELAYLQLAQLKPPIEAVGGLTLGADPIGTSVSLAAYRAGVQWPAFIVRKESKGHGTGRYIEGIDNLKPGARVCVLEDVVTTGESGLKAVQRLRDAGFKPVLILAVLDRQEGGEAAIRSAGLDFIALTRLSELSTGR